MLVEQVMGERRAYPSDLTDEQWAVVGQAREKAGRREDPSAIILDTQSIRAANHVPAATTGKDARRRCQAVNEGWPSTLWD